jgi:hypothetical protein
MDLIYISQNFLKIEQNIKKSSKSVYAIFLEVAVMTMSESNPTALGFSQCINIFALPLS